jgi:hypothetical protein
MLFNRETTDMYDVVGCFSFLPTRTDNEEKQQIFYSVPPPPFFFLGVIIVILIIGYDDRCLI